MFRNKGSVLTNIQGICDIDRLKTVDKEIVGFYRLQICWSVNMNKQKLDTIQNKCNFFMKVAIVFF